MATKKHQDAKSASQQTPESTVRTLDQGFLLAKVDTSSSVRSTFTLTAEASKILDALSEQGNITPREVFDKAYSQGWFKELAEQIQQSKVIDKRTVRRTLVLSAKSLEHMDKSCKDKDKGINIKRDDLACMVIRSMLDTYNVQISKTYDLWNVVYNRVESAVTMIDDRPAIKYIEEAEQIPSHLRKSLADWLSNTIENLILSYIPNELESDWSHDLPEELLDIRSIAQNLKPITLEEESK
ncbi:MAG: hypothetical protein HQ568_11165 [Calditrichaeota bacterium]|nr:hypothetical protein [Calditrichota bacterium]